MFDALRGWIRGKRESKNILCKPIFRLKDMLRGSSCSDRPVFMEKELEMKLKGVLKIIQKETFRSTYFGIPAIKSPLDFWVYSELIYEITPDVIVEIGNYSGGSTLAYAHMLDHIGKGRVIGVDVDHEKVPEKVKTHPRVVLITGDACGSFPEVKNLIKEEEKVLVIEDSSHMYENTLNVLRTYNSLVKKGSYFIVEDGIINHGLNFRDRQKTGPYEAVESFIGENGRFEIDRSRERFFITWNPKGYLKCIR
ncbi:CmcI family methyltransferase [Candidatus Omnitrophota bacterium]